MYFTIFQNVALMLVYMSIGLALCKAKLAEPSHAKSMSGLLIYVLSPCMIINSFLQMEFSREIAGKMAQYFIVSLIVQIAFFIFMYLLFSRKYEDARYRMLSCGAVLGNTGFFGMPVLYSIFPDNPIVMCYSSIHVVSMNLLVFTIGAFMITNDRKYVSVKSAICNPTTISGIIAVVLFGSRIVLPNLVLTTISNFSKVVTPMCMIILGMRLASTRFKDLFTRPFVYATSLYKLLVFPVFAFVCVRFIPFIDTVSKSSIFILSAVPAAAVIQSIAELYECEQENAANVVLLTTIISVVTMPVVVTLLMRFM